MCKSSLTGTRDEAISIQAQLALPPEIRGPWFHDSKHGISVFTDHINEQDNDDPFTWFSRSPLGGGHAGGVVLLTYFIALPSRNRLFHAAYGDPLGREGQAFLPDWWLALHKTEVNKVMVVDMFPPNQLARLKALCQDGEYLAIRKRAVERLGGDA